MTYIPKVGHRVRIVFDGVVEETEVESNGWAIGIRGYWFDRDDVTVERLPDPEKQCKPGESL